MPSPFIRQCASSRVVCTLRMRGQHESAPGPVVLNAALCHSDINATDRNLDVGGPEGLRLPKIHHWNSLVLFSRRGQARPIRRGTSRRGRSGARPPPGPHPQRGAAPRGAGGTWQLHSFEPVDIGGAAVSCGPEPTAHLPVCYALITANPRLARREIGARGHSQRGAHEYRSAAALFSPCLATYSAGAKQRR